MRQHTASVIRPTDKSQKNLAIINDTAQSIYRGRQNIYIYIYIYMPRGFEIRREQQQRVSTCVLGISVGFAVARVFGSVKS